MDEQLRKKLASAVSTLTNPLKDREGYGYKYAGLDKVIDRVRNALSIQDLAVTQHVEAVDNGYELVTTVYGEAGEAILDRRPVWLGPDMQQGGSSETYARRYALLSVFGMAGVDDDDGAATKGSVAQPIQRRTKERGADKALARRKHMIERCIQLEDEFVQLGGTPGALKKWVEAQGMPTDYDAMTDQQVISYGRYAAEMVEQLKTMQAEKAEK